MGVSRREFSNSIVLRPVKTRLDMRMACTLEDTVGRPIANVRSVDSGLWQRFNRVVSASPGVRYVFEVVTDDGALLLSITRPIPRRLRDQGEYLDIRDPAGSAVGTLRQAKRFFGGRQRFVLESGQRVIGHANRSVVRAVRMAIEDGEGRSIATISTTRHDSPARTRYFYTLAFSGTLDPTTRSLCLAVVIAEYFDDWFRGSGPRRSLFWWWP